MLLESRFSRLAGACLLGAVSMLAPRAEAHEPTDPLVQEMAMRGVQVLRNLGERDRANTSLGGVCLAAQAVYSVTKDVNEPRVQLALDACRQTAARQLNSHEANYELGFAINFLAKVVGDVPDAKQLMAALWAQLLARQRQDGGWSYANYQTGDTSQTQYAAFGMWEVHNYKVAEIPKDSVEKLSNWLLRTQDPNGGWGYQGNDPGTGSTQRVQQTDVRHSLCAAGAGSLYICADLLGLSKAKQDEQTSDISSVFKKADEPQGDSRRTIAGASINTDRLRNGLNDADGWFARNYNIETSKWQYYYLYGLERYQTFREIVIGREEKSPGWYNDGVEWLRSKQAADGSWDSTWQSSSVGVDTSFAVLFLMRSTKQATDVVTREGQLRGGNGLPKDLTNLRLNDDGTLESPTAEEQLKDLSDLLEEMSERTDLDVDDFDPTQFVIKKEEKQSQFDQLKQKVLGSEKYTQRLVAVQVLAAQRENLDQVPILIYALTDPDIRVALAARDALRMISRKIDGFGLPDNFQTQDGPEVRAAVDAWKRWFLSIRPDATFEF